MDYFGREDTLTHEEQVNCFAMKCESLLSDAIKAWQFNCIFCEEATELSVRIIAELMKRELIRRLHDESVK